ncbi:putative modifying wall lignin-1/2 [Helianthus annuus]|uniref:Uncharacterized protein n=1 Tax=Helianthus annuus TaxID=4232 RepID=A0A251VA11_HELAN|nr:uncharacterized protein LOC110930519 isoform X3 [Helianthus annuus]XP_035843614.1 uncharacterized protein LOC110930519 isoform X3 [Helianthus annuus]XP_035843615.1 uncharacterized protein LOC110930519 isoform X3 [Helianthus annuus]XP_035843616.1 uncharacterized protein LOC110930519 isoform X3 [Helianthus annuus]XP_035843617.1 uncharacterized protein LOC110930519 isoform X3 [Helianthus annuus]XP_035843618.1 uncharacterized protein LOC110930519 isoform X3 [Helianthus annuus]XP_035843619.1 un
MVIRRSMIVAGVVLLLGLICAAAGFAAELTRVKSSQMKIVDGKCVHPSNPVMGLAITAAVAMILLRVVVRVATGSGYACCRTRPDVPKLIRYCIFIAWLLSFAAVGQFIAGAHLCNRKDLQLTLAGESCYALKPGLFSTAAIWALVSMGLTLFYYLVIASAENVPNKPPASEVEAPSVTKDHHCLHRCSDV